MCFHDQNLLFISFALLELWLMQLQIDCMLYFLYNIIIVVVFINVDSGCST